MRIGAAAVLLAGLVNVGRTQSASPREPLGQIWSRPMQDVIALALSPDGERLVASDLQGRVRCYDNHGSVLWERLTPDADGLAVSRGSAVTLAYSERRPLSREVSFLDGNGRRFYTLQPSQAVQTATVSPDGRYAAIAAGRSVVFCSVTAQGVRYRIIRMKGLAQQVLFAPGDTVYVACREPCYVARVKSTGKVLWEQQFDTRTQCTVSASMDGKTLGVATFGVDDTVQVALVDARNQELWHVSRPGRSPRIHLCAEGTAVLLSYEHKVDHNQESRYERRLAYLTADQNQQWTKGGAYSAPLYVSVDHAGEWVVALDTQQSLPRFRLYGRGGERRWIYTSSSDVLIATSSSEGRHIATYRADGAVEMVGVSEP